MRTTSQSLDIDFTMYYRADATRDAQIDQVAEAFSGPDCNSRVVDLATPMRRALDETTQRAAAETLISLRHQ